MSIQLGPLNDEDLDIGFPGSCHLLVETATLTTLFGKDGIGMELADEGISVIVLVVDQMVEGELVLFSQ